MSVGVGESSAQRSGRSLTTGSMSSAYLVAQANERPALLIGCYQIPALGCRRDGVSDVLANVASKMPPADNLVQRLRSPLVLGFAGGGLLPSLLLATGIVLGVLSTTARRVTRRSTPIARSSATPSRTKANSKNTSMIGFRIPAHELSIIWRYLDGVSRALAARFEGGSSPHEENLTFLLCELLDDNTTSRHVLEYPLSKAKQELEQSDGGIALDVSFQTHEHSRFTESKFSFADLGVIFVLEHPHFGRTEKAVLLQAKRLFPKRTGYTSTSTFDSFDPIQFAGLKEVEKNFVGTAGQSAFYLWYAPSSTAFPDIEDAKLLRSLEASLAWDWQGLRGWNPFLDAIVEYGGPWNSRRWMRPAGDAQHEDQLREWRRSQPATRVSSLAAVDAITQSGAKPGLLSLYSSRHEMQRGRRPWQVMAFEPLAELFLLGLLSDGLGDDDADWLRLARGERMPLPVPRGGHPTNLDLPEHVPAPRHTLTLTVRSTVQWPANEPR